ncbi:hydrophobin 1 [Halenospora varia]|nr:hydrophobin 1 [Halenospora varia]
MQFTTIVTLLAVTVASVSAMPGRPAPPERPAPVITHNANTCSSGDPFCCSPNDKTSGTVCQKGATQCNTISICCINNNVGNGAASQGCSASNSLQQPVIWI